MQECQRWITSTEFNEWLAFYLLEPFGSERNDQHFGTIAAMLYNVNRSKSKRALKWNDVFPQFEQHQPKTSDELLSIVEDLNMAFGGKDLRATKNTPTA